MTRFELIQKLVEDYPHLYASDVERIVAAIFDEIASALSRGDRVELRGFGTLVTKKREARQGRNPRSGDNIDVLEKHIPFFRTGRPLSKRLNEEM
jgi:integration host factor subunit beta